MESFSGLYDLGEGKLLGVDQSGPDGDMTALCFAKVTSNGIVIKWTKVIEQSEDIEQYMLEV